MAKALISKANVDLIMQMFGLLNRLPDFVGVSAGIPNFTYRMEGKDGGDAYYMHVGVPIVENKKAPSPNDKISFIKVDSLIDGKEIVSISGLDLPFKQLAAGAGLSDSDERYAFWVSLLDGNVSVKSAKNVDFTELEVGKGGTAEVTGGDGIEKLHVWHQKNIDFNGGGGADTISFTSSYGDPYPTAAKQQLVVDLSKGTGQNPYGGTLTLSNVENVIGTAGADKITGDGRANKIGDPFDTGADQIKAGGGNDTIVLGGGIDGGAHVDGGKGKDTLNFLVAGEFAGVPARVVLDLDHPELNTFVFKGGSYTGIEIFAASGFGGAGDTDMFVFGGSSASETVTGTSIQSYVPAQFRAEVGRDELSGRGGADTLIGFAGLDKLSGGSGNDTLMGGPDGDKLLGGSGLDAASYADARAAVTASLAEPSVNLGDAAGDTYSSIEALVGSIYADKLTGNNEDNTIAGGAESDTLKGGGGKDTFLFDTNLSAETNVDAITDFSHADDRFKLDRAVFAGLKEGKLSSDAFHLGTKAGDKEDRILYDKKHGYLYFDGDGSVKTLSGIKFAHLSESHGKFPSLDHTDFLVL